MNAAFSVRKFTLTEIAELHRKRSTVPKRTLCKYAKIQAKFIGIRTIGNDFRVKEYFRSVRLKLWMQRKSYFAEAFMLRNTPFAVGDSEMLDGGYEFPPVVCRPNAKKEKIIT